MKGYIDNMAKRENTIKIIENTIPEDDTVIETTNDAITDENVSDVQEEIKPLNMEEKITLKNLANWMVGFNKLETNGEVNIKAGGSIRLSRAEVISQFENGNKLLRGNGKRRQHQDRTGQSRTRYRIVHHGKICSCQRGDAYGKLSPNGPVYSQCV